MKSQKRRGANIPGLVVISGIALSFALASDALAKGAYRGAPPRPRVPSAGNNAQANAWVNNVQARIVNAWIVPDGKNHVVITSTVDADGGMTDIATASTPKNAEAENAANDAFTKALPLQALPANLGSKAKLSVTFSSNADPHGDTSRNVYVQINAIPVAKEAPKTQESPASK